MSAGLIELALLFALGFLAATLLSLLIMPLLSRRAERRARARLERQMPMSMAEIVAERDQLRAAHAVELRLMEQRVEGADGRIATAMGDAGRETKRAVDAEGLHAAAKVRIAQLETDLAASRRATAEAEAVVAAQAASLKELTARHDERGRQLETEQKRAADAEAALEEQKRAQQELKALQARTEAERQVAVAAAEALRAAAADTEVKPAADIRPEPPSEMSSAGSTVDAVPAVPPTDSTGLPAASERLGDDVVQLRTALTRLRTEQDILQKGLTASTEQRDRLRLRVDELLLKIDDLQDDAEQAKEQAEDDRRQAARHAKAVTTLTDRVAARDEALKTLRQQLAEETARRQALESGGATARREDTPADEPALRSAIAALAADLVQFAQKGSGGPGGPPA